MSSTAPNAVTISTLIKQSRERVWELYTGPEHIVQWSFATSDWYCPTAINDLRPGGTFDWRLQSKNGQLGFNIKGRYTAVTPGERIAYQHEDGRRSEIDFEEVDGKTRLSIHFSPNDHDPVDLQCSGWQAILDNFCRYAEQRG